MNLSLHLATKRETVWAKEVVRAYHYLHTWPHWQSRPSVYVVKLGRMFVGVVVVTIPHATQNKGWWGYPGLPTQWQVVDLSRIWLDPCIQRGGSYCSPDYLPGFIDRHDVFQPTTLTEFVIPQVLERAQRDRLAHWPPRWPDKPYHIELAISYHDPLFHKGTIYKESGAIPMYADGKGNPVPSDRGKYGWCWPLERPTWAWNEIEIARPRPMMLAI